MAGHRGHRPGPCCMQLTSAAVFQRRGSGASVAGLRLGNVTDGGAACRRARSAGGAHLTRAGRPTCPAPAPPSHRHPRPARSQHYRPRSVPLARTRSHRPTGAARCGSAPPPTSSSASPRQFDFPPIPIFNAPARPYGLVGPVSRELRLTIRAANGSVDLSPPQGRKAHDVCARVPCPAHRPGRTEQDEIGGASAGEAGCSDPASPGANSSEPGLAPYHGQVYRHSL